MRTLIVIAFALGLVTIAPAAAAGGPPGYGHCEVNKDPIVWVESHDGLPVVVVDGTWRPLECYW